MKDGLLFPDYLGQLISDPINTSYQGLLVAGSQLAYIRCNHAPYP